MSDSYVGGSSANASGSSLTQGILGSVIQAGEAYGLSNVTPNLTAPRYQTPPSYPIVPMKAATSSSMTIIIVIVLAVVGIFAFKKL